MAAHRWLAHFLSAGHLVCVCVFQKHYMRDGKLNIFLGKSSVLGSQHFRQLLSCFSRL